MTKNYLRIPKKLSHRGTYVDHWTCVHFASGMCLGFLLSRAGIPFTIGSVVATIAFVFWEFVEPPLHRLIGRQFPEKVSNQIVDVIAGLIGYVVGFALDEPYTLYALLLDVLDFLAN